MTVATDTPTRGQPILDRLVAVYREIDAAAQAAGRHRVDITVVAVSKGVADDLVTLVRQYGQEDFGESRARSLKARLDQVDLPATRWHFIGHLQRNDIPKVVGNATVIHSLDHLAQAEAISDEALRKGQIQRAYIQVNVDKDPNKGGIPLDTVPAFVAKTRHLSGLAIQGLSTIGAKTSDPNDIFGQLAQTRDDLRATWPEILHLSMGMSNDFPAAIAHGATVLRIGRAIFGEG